MPTDDPPPQQTPTTLLGGIAWLPGGPLLTAGADGLIYRVDPDRAPPTKVETRPSPPHAKRVRVVLARPNVQERVVLTADLDGVALAWTESSRPFAVYPPAAGGSTFLDPEVLADDGTLAFALDDHLFRWTPTSDPSVVATTLADLPATGRGLAVLPKANGRRVAWLDASQPRVQLFDPEGTAGEFDRGGVGLTEKVVALAVPTGLDGFDAVGASGLTRRFRFPEDRTPPDFSKARFPAIKARGRSRAGRFLVAEDADHKVRRLLIDPSSADEPQASTAAIHDGTDSGRTVVALAAGGPNGDRLVALLHEGVGVGRAAARICDIAKLDDASWRDVAKDLDSDCPGTLAVSDSGRTAALVARSAAGDADPVLHRFDLTAATPSASPVPSPSGAGSFTYKDTSFATFLPGSESAWLLATRAGSARTLRHVSVDSNGAVTTKVVVQRNQDLALAPESTSIAVDAFLIASAWADGAVRVDQLVAGVSTKVGEVMVDSSDPGKVVALALKPDGRRLAALALAPSGAAALVVWDVNVKVKHLIGLERIARPETLPTAPRFLAWRGEDLALATADGGTLVVALAGPSATEAFLKPEFGTPIGTVSRAAVSPGRTLAAYADDTAKVIGVAKLNPAGAPTPLGAFGTPSATIALEFVSDLDLATVDSATGQLLVYRATSAAPGTFKSLAPWPDPTLVADRRVAAIRHIDDRSLVARLQGGRLVLLTLPDPGSLEAPSPTTEREASAVGRPAAVKTSDGPQIAVFQNPAPDRRLGVWLGSTNSLQQADSAFPPPPPGPPQTLNTITAAAWTVEAAQLKKRPAFGLADGRLWLPDPGNAGTYLPVNPPGMPSPSGILVRALAHHPRQPWLAIAWTLDGNRVAVRNTTAPKAEQRSLDLDAGGPPTALAFDPSGRFLAAATSQGRIRVWKVEAATDGSAVTFTPLPEPTPPPTLSGRDVEAVAFNIPRAGGPVRLAAIDDRGLVGFWKVPGDGSAVTSFGTRSPAVGTGPVARRAGLAWEPGGDRVGVSMRDGRVFVFTAPSP